MKVTGSIGKVMEESASIAFSLVRGRCDKWNIDPEFFNTNDFHIHVPDGATPKDGPSAGVTLSLALISCLRKVPLRKKLAMTGEITLRGKILPVGGIKEKILVAINNNIKTIYVPIDNKADVKEIDKNIIKGIKIKYIDNYLELYNDLF